MDLTKIGDPDIVLVLPQDDYDYIKNNMYIGPIYKGIDAAICHFIYDNDIKKLLKESCKICENTLGMPNHPISTIALNYIKKSVTNYEELHNAQSKYDLTYILQRIGMVI